LLPVKITIAELSNRILTSKNAIAELNLRAL